LERGVIVGQGAAVRSFFQRFPYQWVVATTFVLGLFMDILDLTIVNVSLVQIAEQFGASTSSIAWVVLGYSLSLAIWVPVSGWIGDRFGLRRTFLFALTLFVVGSALCGEAQSIEQLVGFRLLQGVGGGMLTPVGTALLFRAFPPAERARASAILAIPTVIAPATGPVFGGLLTDTVGWRWNFRINVPIGIIALVIGIFGLRSDEPSEPRPFDATGFALIVLGFPSLVFCLEQGTERGWTSPVIIATGVVAAVSLALMVWWARRTTTPMLDLGLFRERLFRTTNIVNFSATMSFLGVVFILPLFLQRIAGYTAFQAGLATFPQALGAIVSNRLVARLYPKVGPRRLMTVGYIGIAVATIPLLFVTSSVDPWAVRTTMFVRGLFLACTFIPLQACFMARISPAETGRASALFSTGRQLASATGVALLSTVLIGAAPGALTPPAIALDRDGYVTAFHWAFVAAIVLTLIAAMLATLIKDSDAAATLSPSRPTSS
jgi:EmrB/QacA subfamily drug resistance transporter